MSECTNGELRDLLPELVNGQLDAEMQRAVEAHVGVVRGVRGGVGAAALAAAGTHARAGGRRAQDRGGGARADCRRDPGARPLRTHVATPWRIAIAAAALLAVSAIGYAGRAQGHGAQRGRGALHRSDTRHSRADERGAGLHRHPRRAPRVARRVARGAATAGRGRAAAAHAGDARAPRCVASVGCARQSLRSLRRRRARAHGIARRHLGRAGCGSVAPASIRWAHRWTTTPREAQ